MDRCIFVGVWMTVKLLGPVASGEIHIDLKLKQQRDDITAVMPTITVFKTMLIL